MRLPVLVSAGVFLSLILLAGCSPGTKRPTLEIHYGDKGIQQLTYNGVVLEDLAENPEDVFHIWHMKATDLTGKIKTGSQYGWGETNNGRSWNPDTKTWTYQFTWGSISLQFAQAGDALNMNVVEVNNPNSGIIFNGATIYPFVLHFPQLPVNFKDPQFEHLSSTNDPANIPVADFGKGAVAAIYQDASKPLYHGFEPAAGGTNYVPIISSTSMDSMAAFFPRIDRPVQPGQRDTFTVSLRFAPSGTPAASFLK
jgi:hypothetical protein